MTTKQTLVSAAFLLCLTLVNAQHSEIYVHQDASYFDALTLYGQGKYEASEFALNQLRGVWDSGSLHGFNPKGKE